MEKISPQSPEVESPRRKALLEGMKKITAAQERLAQLEQMIDGTKKRIAAEEQELTALREEFLHKNEGESGRKIFAKSTDFFEEKDDLEDTIDSLKKALAIYLSSREEALQKIRMLN